MRKLLCGIMVLFPTEVLSEGSFSALTEDSRVYIGVVSACQGYYSENRLFRESLILNVVLQEEYDKNSLLDNNPVVLYSESRVLGDLMTYGVCSKFYIECQMIYSTSLGL